MTVRLGVCMGSRLLLPWLLLWTDYDELDSRSTSPQAEPVQYIFSDADSYFSEAAAWGPVHPVSCMQELLTSKLPSRLTCILGMTVMF